MTSTGCVIKCLLRSFDGTFGRCICDDQKKIYKPFARDSDSAILKKIRYSLRVFKGKKAFCVIPNKGNFLPYFLIISFILTTKATAMPIAAIELWVSVVFPIKRTGQLSSVLIVQRIGWTNHWFHTKSTNCNATSVIWRHRELT